MSLSVLASSDSLKHLPTPWSVETAQRIRGDTPHGVLSESTKEFLLYIPRHKSQLSEKLSTRAPDGGILIFPFIFPNRTKFPVARAFHSGEDREEMDSAALLLAMTVLSSVFPETGRALAET